MAKDIARRLNNVEASLDAKMQPPVDLSIVELDDDGCISGFHIAYRFDASGAVIGMRFGARTYHQQSFKSIREMRNRAFADPMLAELWREVMLRVEGHSRGLPYGDTEADRERRQEARRAQQAKDDAMRARVENDARRRRGEGEWGDRVVPILMAMCGG